MSVDITKSFTIKNGLGLNDAIFIFEGTADPTASSGVYAPTGSIYLQYSTSNITWLKTGSGNTQWTQFSLVGSSLLRSANDFNTFTLKGTPTTSDRILIEDVANGGNKSYITIGSLPSSGSSGGYTTYATISAMSSASGTNGQVVFCQKVNSFYVYKTSSAFTKDGYYVVATASGGSTAWVSFAGNMTFQDTLVFATTTSSSVAQEEADIVLASGDMSVILFPLLNIMASVRGHKKVIFEAGTYTFGSTTQTTLNNADIEFVSAQPLNTPSTSSSSGVYFQPYNNTASVQLLAFNDSSITMKGITFQNAGTGYFGQIFSINGGNDVKNYFAIDECCFGATYNSNSRVYPILAGSTGQLDVFVRNCTFIGLASPSNSYQIFLSISGASYVEVKGCYFQYGVSNNSFGYVYLNNCRNVNIVDNKFYNALGGSNLQDGVEISNSTFVNISKNEFTSTTGNNISSYITGCTGVNVSNNLFTNSGNSSMGMNIAGTNNLNIEGNTFVNVYTELYFISSASSNIFIKKNYFNSTNGTYCISESTSNYINGAIITDNVMQKPMSFSAVATNYIFGNKSSSSIFATPTVTTSTTSINLSVQDFISFQAPTGTTTITSFTGLRMGTFIIRVQYNSSTATLNFNSCVYYPGNTGTVSSKSYNVGGNASKYLLITVFCDGTNVFFIDTIYG